MKKMKGFRKVLAGLLVLCMIMGCGVAVLADDGGFDVYTEPIQEPAALTIHSGKVTNNEWTIDHIVVTDDNDNTTEEKSLTVKEIKSLGDNPGVYVEDNNREDVINISISGGDGAGISSTRSDAIKVKQNDGEINLNKNQGEYQNPVNVTGAQDGIKIESNSGTINFTEDNVTGTNGDGIHIGGTADGEKNTGTIILNTGNITGGDDGIEINNNFGSVQINAGHVTAVSDGVVSDVYDGGEADITVEDVKVEGDGTRGVTGISVNQADGAGAGTTTVNADSVSASTEGFLNKAYGVLAKDGTVVIGEKEGSTGDVTATSAHAYATGIEAQGNAKVTVNGNVTAIEKQIEIDDIPSTYVNFAAVGVKAYGNSNVTVNGNVTATSENKRAGYGVRVADRDGQANKSTVTVNGEKIEAKTTGIDIYLNNDSSDVTVNAENAEVTGKTGIDAYSEKGSLTVTAGKVTGDNNGINASGFATATVTVNGDVTGKTGSGVGAYAWSNIAKTYVTVNGNVSGKENGVSVVSNNYDITPYNDAIASVIVDGNVTGGANGLNVQQGRGNKAKIVVTGSISGEKNGIRLENVGYYPDVDITAWEVKGGESLIDWEENNSNYNKVAENIHYIVKLADGLNNDQVVTDKGKTITINKGQENEKTWQTAKENEIVTLTLTDEQLADYNPEKNELEVLYNADDATSKMALGTSTGNGVFTFVNKVITLVMQSGGGMKLGFSFKARTPEVQPEENKPEVKPDEKPEEKPEVKPEDKPAEQPVVPAKEETEAKPEDKPKEEKVESKQEAKTDEPKQEATQTVADTTSTIATTGTATVYNLLKIKDKSGKAELAFRNVGKYEIKSPDGNDEGSFGMEDGKIVLTSQTGKKMNIGQDGKLEYVIGNQTYEFKFGEADLEKLAAVKK